MRNNQTLVGLSLSLLPHAPPDSLKYSSNRAQISLAFLPDQDCEAEFHSNPFTLLCPRTAQIQTEEGLFLGCASITAHLHLFVLERACMRGVCTVFINTMNSCVQLRL